MGERYYLNPVRHPEDVGVAHIRRTVNYDMPGIGTTGIPIGALEAGAVPGYAMVYVHTAFNAATTNNLLLGTVDDDDGFVVTGGSLAGATGFKGQLTGALTGIPLAADKVVYAKYTQTGTAATAGKAMVLLEFYNKREVDTIAFPNN